MVASTPSATLRARWLDALLPNVPFDGWTDDAAKTAAESADLSTGEQALAAPRGVIDLIDHLFDAAEETARATITAADLSTLGVRDRVTLGVKAWLSALEPDREAVRKAAAKGFLPWVAGDSLQRTWSVADMVWTATGDPSEDFNKYSKRGLLAATIPLIVLKWLDEDDPDRMDAYIRARLTGAMRLGQAGGRVAKPVLDVLGRLRRRMPGSGAT
ncbi:MAG: COQ9 family protein [Pseudomonadota bacterium]